MVALLLGAWPLVARADVDFKFGGMISSDLRYRLGGEEIPPQGTQVPYPSQERLLKYGFSRNENRIKAQLSLTISDRVKAVADVDFVWYGYSDVKDIQADTLHDRVDPYYLEAAAAYIDVYRIVPHVDLRIGRQVVNWGTADKFNPTNNLNTLDLSDPLLFGKALANNMVRIDYNPIADLVLTAVWVPIFRPAQLPRTAPLAVTEPQRPAPVQEADIRDALGQLAVANPPTQVNVYTLQPETSLSNSQVGVRLGGRLWGQDLSLSYYHGRWGIPTPAWVTNGPGGVVNVGVIWPKMDVLGFDWAGSLEKLRGLGYWFEGAVIFPQEVTYGVYNDTQSGAHQAVTFQPLPGGGHQVSIGTEAWSRGTVIPSTPFVKLTAGLDFTFNKYLYSNIQYVYGFIDEFGAGTTSYAKPGAHIGDEPRTEARIGHYIVAGSDIKLFSDQLLIRLFAAFKSPQMGDQDPKFTAVIFPQLAWAVWDATELSLGAFIFLGDRDTKFGDPAAGASELFCKAKFTY